MLRSVTHRPRRVHRLRRRCKQPHQVFHQDRPLRTQKWDHDNRPGRDKYGNIYVSMLVWLITTSASTKWEPGRHDGRERSFCSILHTCRARRFAEPDTLDLCTCRIWMRSILQAMHYVTPASQHQHTDLQDRFNLQTPHSTVSDVVGRCLDERGAAQR